MEGKTEKGLIIVDVQNDFCEGGSLAVPGASTIIPIINGLRQNFNNIVLTADWHPVDHVSFHTYHEGGAPFTKIFVNGSEQELWPPHCVQNTQGANFHPALHTKETDIIVRKGQAPEHDDSYSGFGKTGAQTELHQKLQELNVGTIYLTGLALDVCVWRTAVAALQLGYKVIILEDACKGIQEDNFSNIVEQGLKELQTSGKLKGELQIQNSKNVS